MSSVRDEDMPCCSAVTVAEIRAGMRDEEEPATMAFLESFDILSIDKKVAQIAGDLEKKNKTTATGAGRLFYCRNSTNSSGGLNYAQPQTVSAQGSGT